MVLGYKNSGRRQSHGPDLQRMNQSASALKKYRPLKYFVAKSHLYRSKSASGLAVVVMAAPRASGIGAWVDDMRRKRAERTKVH